MLTEVSFVTPIWINLLHYIGMTLWLGGGVFLLAIAYPALKPKDANQLISPTFIDMAKRFNVVQLFAILCLISSGMAKVQLLGGMKVLPTLIHIKIALALLMVIMALITHFYCLGKLKASSSTETLVDEAHIQAQKRLLKLYLFLNADIVITGFAIIGLLCMAGIV